MLAIAVAGSMVCNGGVAAYGAHLGANKRMLLQLLHVVAYFRIAPLIYRN